MADVLFGQSYYLRFDSKLWAAMQPYPPLGTLIAAAYLRDRGYDVALFDAMLATSEGEWEEALEREKPRFAVLFEDNFNYLSKMCLLRMREAAFTMIRAARKREVTVLVCGSDASDHPEEYLGSGAHYVLVGEGEVTLGELVGVLDRRASGALESLPGLAFRNGQGVTRTAPRGVLRDLDALPLPAWDLVDIPRYRDAWRRRHGYYSMNMATTRGCPYHCNWCAKPIWGQTYHMRSPTHVARELAHLKTTYRPDHIWFADDIMGLKRGWMAEFADHVEALDAKLPFKCLSRVDLLLRDGEVESLRRAGCQIVWVGAESGSQRVLDAMDKGTRVEQIHEATARLRAAGVGIGFFLQFGYPGEEREDIEKTLAMIRQCRPDEIGMSVSYPLPGTRFYELVRQELGKKRNWVDSDDLDMMFEGPFTTAFYRQLYRVVQREYRGRKAGWQLLDLSRRPRSLRVRHVRKVGALLYHFAALPLARRRLDRLARIPHRGVGPLTSGMSPGQAARPTPQGPEG